MPFIPPNRGKTSQPEKPPWVRDSSSQQSADVPWRRNNVGKLSTPERSQPPAPRPTGSQPSKPGPSKLQISLKSTVKKPEPPPPEPEPETESSSEEEEEESSEEEEESSPSPPPTPKPAPSKNIPVKKEISIPIVKEISIPIQITSTSNTSKSNSPSQPPPSQKQNQSQTQPQSKHSSANHNKDSKPLPNKNNNFIQPTPPVNNSNVNTNTSPNSNAGKVNASASPTVKNISIKRESDSGPLQRKSEKSETPPPSNQNQSAPTVKRNFQIPSKPKPQPEPESQLQPPSQPSIPNASTLSKRERPSSVNVIPIQTPTTPDPPFGKNILKPASERKRTSIRYPQNQNSQNTTSPSDSSEAVSSNSQSSPAPSTPEPKPTVASKMPVNNKNVGGIPPPPPPPPGGPPPPPPPPPPGLPPLPGGPPKTAAGQAKLEQLRKVPKKRPDWSVMMKEIETARKLKHVECNDRSKPIIPRMKSRGKFVFDSEAKPANKADAVHNRLLTEIQGGIKLKKVQCNDRSKPILSGLRKFRRQMTMEEKDKDKKDDAAEDPTTTTPAEELIAMGIDIDDIDTLRDELQSAKQMLELEIQAKILLAKENRDLKCENITMEAKIDDLKYKLQEQLSLIPYDEGRRDSRAFKDLRKSKSGLYKCPSGVKKSKSGFGGKGAAGGKDKDGNSKKDEEDDLEEIGEFGELEEEINVLRNQVHSAKKVAEDWEAKFKEASEKLLLAQGKFEDSEQRLLVLNKKIEKLQSQKGVSVSSNDKWTQTEEQIQQMQGRRVSRQLSTTRKPSTAGGDGGGGDGLEADTGDEFDTDDEDLEVDEATVIRKKEEREIKLWENKFRNIKEKQMASKLERKSLKMQQKKLEAELKEQKSRLKELQKEVDKMAKMLKGDGNDGEGGSDDDVEKDSEEETETEDDDEDDDEEDSDEESSSESEEEESSSEEDDASASHEDRVNLFTKRVKRRDNILNALRKGNYLLRANIDRLKDDLEDVRIKYHDLEHELNTVLADV